MTQELQEAGDSPQTVAIKIWRAMSLGPVALLLSLLLGGIEFLALDSGWWVISESAEHSFGLLLLALAPNIAISAIVLGEIIGGFYVYSKRSELADTPYESHATSAIRTFWIMTGGFVVTLCVVLSLLLIPDIDAVGFGVAVVVIMAATAPLFFIWKTFRIVRGLRRAREGKAIADNPTRWS